MFKKNFMLLALTITGVMIAPAQVFAYTDDIGNTDATTASPSEGKINYQDKNLANYQDPYLTNQRAYKSNEYGEAAPAPQPNVFYSVGSTAYSAPVAQPIQNQDLVTGAGVTYIDR